MIKDLSKTVLHGAFFAGLSYVSVETLKYGVTLYRGTKWSYLIAEPAGFTKIMALDSLKMAGIGAVFIAVDFIAKKIFEFVLGQNASDPDMVLARLAISVFVSGSISVMSGLTESMGLACGIILMSIAVYSVVHRVIGAYEWGRYGNAPGTRP